MIKVWIIAAMVTAQCQQERESRKPPESVCIPSSSTFCLSGYEIRQSWPNFQVTLDDKTTGLIPSRASGDVFGGIVLSKDKPKLKLSGDVRCYDVTVRELVTKPQGGRDE